MNIESLEKELEARHIGLYAPGHMGSQILRFRSKKDESPMVVKFASQGDVEANEDFEANIRGYAKIQILGGSSLVPEDLKEIPVANGRALVMRDLGASMRVADSGIEACAWLWKHFKQVIIQTSTQKTEVSYTVPPQFVVEAVRHIERFSSGRLSDFLEALRKSDWAGEWGKSAIMLFDFTPDNLFVNEEKLSFIDPWNQETYLGHPAVSIGQFVTLMQLYRMKDAEVSARILKERCVLEMPAMLGCDALLVERAWRLGSTLQFVLSSYVRRESDPLRSAELADLACKLW